MRIGVIGASSLVGESLLPILVSSGCGVVAFSRQPHKDNGVNIEWKNLSEPLNSPPCENQKITTWICVAPIWVLPDYFDLLKSYGVKRVLAISSTSCFTKENSLDIAERAVAQKLIDGETALQDWAEINKLDWCIFRTTMIYGHGKDKNVAEISRLINRWRFFPMLGRGFGLRQPVHADDVSKACLDVIECDSSTWNHSYNISGAETLSYKEMINRIFIALGKKPRFIHLPRWMFRLALLGLRLLPRYKAWSLAMVDRMDRDLVFDSKEAASEFGYSPRFFVIENRDLP